MESFRGRSSSGNNLVPSPRTPRSAETMLSELGKLVESTAPQTGNTLNHDALARVFAQFFERDDQGNKLLLRSVVKQSIANNSFTIPTINEIIHLLRHDKQLQTKLIENYSITNIHIEDFLSQLEKTTVGYFLLVEIQQGHNLANRFKLLSQLVNESGELTQEAVCGIKKLPGVNSEEDVLLMLNVIRQSVLDSAREIMLPEKASLVRKDSPKIVSPRKPESPRRLDSPRSISKRNFLLFSPSLSPSLSSSVEVKLDSPRTDLQASLTTVKQTEPATDIWEDWSYNESDSESDSLATDTESQDLKEMRPYK